MRLFRQALRRLAADPGFSVLAIATLALGIAANAAIFGVVDAVLLRPLPYPQADRLVMPSHSAPGLQLEGIGQSMATFLRYREHNRVFDGMALFATETVALTGDGTPERLAAAAVSAGFFETCGILPSQGRSFSSDEEKPGTAAVVVLSDAFWHRRFAGAPVLGRSLAIDGVAHEVVGVMPPRFELPTEVEIWRPMKLDPATADLGSFGTGAIARLRNGVTLEAAVADLNSWIADLEAAFPDQSAAKVLARAGFVAEARTLRDAAVGDVESKLWTLLGAVGFVLIIACANVANLFLVQAETRQRERAIRLSLGATRGGLAREAIAESLLLSAAAGALGLTLAGWGLRLLARFGPDEVPRLADAAIDVRVVGFGIALALLTGCLFGLLPLLQRPLAHLAETLRDSTRGTTGGRRRLVARRLLVAGQVALAVVVLVVSGLMARSFDRLASIDPGVRPEGVMTATLALPEAKYTDDVALSRFYAELSDRLAALPGVEAAGVVSWLPVSNEFSGSGHRLADLPAESQELPIVFGTAYVTPSYFETIGIRLLEGRLLTPADADARSGAVVVSQALARERWPGQSAIGKRLFPGSVQGEADPDRAWYEVVGVVGDVHAQLTEEPPEIVYYPMLAKRPGMWTIRQAAIVVRATGDPRPLVDALRSAVWDLDPDLPIADIGALSDRIRAARSQMAFTVVLLAVAASVSLALGAVGTFGIVSYLVTQRTPELGVRVALGAQRHDVARLVLGEGLVLVGLGTAAGLAVAALVARGLGSLFFEVSPLDPATYLAVPAVLLATALLACWLPTRRAVAIDPAVALRDG